MNYLLDKKIKKKKFLNVAFLVIIGFILFYFRTGIFNGFAYAGSKLFYPVLIAGNKLGEQFSGVGSIFVSKNSIYNENENLKSQLERDRAEMADYNSLQAENTSLKEILGRTDEKTAMILAAILGKPNQSPYDTLIIDVGTKDKVAVGETVFALGNVPIGRVSVVYQNSSKVVLLSNPGEKIQAVVSGKNIFMDVVGRGGGNFEMVLPRDFMPVKGDQVVLPGITPYVLGIVETIISDPRDPFVKALLVSPVNVQELKFVEVESAK